VAKFPEPPPVSALAAVPPVTRVLAAGTRCWRIYFQGGPHPGAWNAFRGFGPTSARFDHHLAPPRDQKRQVLYAAAAPLTCLAEVFQETRTIDRRRHAPWLVAFELTQPLELLDLTSRWPTRAGASMAVNSGPRPRARRWSQAIHAAYPTLQGLLYPSSMNANATAYALYERAAGAMPSRPVFRRAVVDAALTGAIVRAGTRLGYAVV
jgi:RES domain